MVENLSSVSPDEAASTDVKGMLCRIISVFRLFQAKTLSCYFIVSVRLTGRKDRQESEKTDHSPGFYSGQTTAEEIFSGITLFCSLFVVVVVLNFLFKVLYFQVKILP